MIYYRLFFAFLLLNSGLLKKIIFLPIDLTILSFVALLPSIFFNKVIIHRSSLKIILSFLPFFLFFCFTSIYTISDSYYETKLFKFSVGFLCLIISLLIFNDERSISIFKKLYFFSFIIVSPLVIYSYLNNTLELYFMSESALVDYLALSSFTAIFFILHFRDNSLLINTLKFLAIIIMIFMGGRGPIISLSLVIFLYYIISFKRTNLKLSNILLFILFSASLSFFIIKTDFADNLLTRFDMILTDFDNQKVNKRIVLWNDALRGIDDSPILGHGIGSYSKYVNNIDARGYPHNIFLEIIFESGFIGLFLFLVFLISVIHFCFKNKEYTYLSLCLAFAFIEAQKSGSLEESRIILMWVGIVFTFISNSKSTYNKKKLIDEQV